MLSFGQTKNSLQKLRNYLKKMQLQSKTQKLTLRQIEQQNLRSSNNEIFLPLLNFLLIEFSSQLYIRILDRVPDLKLKDDRKFIQNCLNIARQMLGVTPGLTPDQFLTNKYFEKKLQFLANLSKSVYEWCTQIRKSKQRQKQTTNPANIQTFSSNQLAYQNTSKLKMQHIDNQLDDFEQEVPMMITAVPMRIDISQLDNDIDSTKQNSNFNTANFALNYQLNKKTKQGSQIFKTVVNKYNDQDDIQDINKNKISKNKAISQKKTPKFVIDGEEFDQHQIQIALQERHPTPQTQHFKKPIQQPICISDRARNKDGALNQKQFRTQQFQHVNQQQQNALKYQNQFNYDRFQLEQNKNQTKKQKNSRNHHEGVHKKRHQNHKEQKNKHLQIQKIKSNKNKEEDQVLNKNSQNYIRKQEFNSLILLVKEMSETVNKLSMKFGQLQTTTNSQINNISARIMMLESKVRVLQDNL